RNTASQAFEKVRNQVLRGDALDVQALTALRGTLPSSAWNDMRSDVLQKIAHDPQGQFSVKQFIKNGRNISVEVRDLLFNRDKVRSEAFNNLIMLAMKIPEQVTKVNKEGSLFHEAMKHFTPKLIRTFYGFVSQMDPGKQLNVIGFKRAIALEAVRAGVSQAMAADAANRIAGQ